MTVLQNESREVARGDRSSRRQSKALSASVDRVKEQDENPNSRESVLDSFLEQRGVLTREDETSKKAAVNSNSDRTNCEDLDASRSVSSRAWRAQVENSLLIIKILKHWDLKFSGEREDDAEKFITRLENCRNSSRIPDEEFLETLPVIFSEEAEKWFQANREQIKTWEDFKKEFRLYFGEYFDDDDLMDELKARTQAEGEKIDRFITNFKTIVRYFEVPPSSITLCRIAYRNLLPAYREYIARARQPMTTLEDFIKLGREHERLVKLAAQYVPPPPKDQMRIPGAAYTTSSSEDSTVSDSATDIECSSESSSIKSSKKRSRKKKRHAETREFAAEQVVLPPTVGPTVSLPSQVKSTPTEVAAIRVKESSCDEEEDCTSSSVKSESVSSRSSRSTRKSHCYTCGDPGHYANQCFWRSCYACKAIGHMAAECPETQNQVVAEICQVCGIKGYTIQNCPSTRCDEVRQVLRSQKLLGNLNHIIVV